MSIPDEIINSIRERISIVELVSESVQLKRAGRNWVGLCPFHSEKSPSFTVRDEEGSFCCFGCGKKGSLFDFVMETRGLTFPEAVQHLANRIGIKIPEPSRWKGKPTGDSGEQKLLRRLLWLCQEAYRDALKTSERGAEAREYLKNRGVSAEMIERFHIGYAPRAWDFIENRVRSYIEASDSLRSEIPLEKLPRLLTVGGVTKRKDRGETKPEVEPGTAIETPAVHTYDVFRDRIIFPITRSDGAPVAFGGRVMHAEDSPKYLNSQESPVYLKRKTLFGLSQGLAAIRKSRHVFLVEGYMDVISMSQVGFENCVATCGTAVTPEHVSVLKRVVDKITVVFDGDVAGRKAAATCFEVFLNSGIELYAVMLDADEDPDSLARKHGKVEIEGIFAARRRPIFDVYVEHLCAGFGETIGNSSAVVLGKVARQAADKLKKVTNPVEREALVERLEKLLGVSVQSLGELMDGKPRMSSEAPIMSAPVRTWENSQGRSRHSSPGTALRPRIDPGRSGITTYIGELLVAVLLEPSLARVTLQGLRDGGNSLPPGVKSFLESVSHSGMLGLRKLQREGEALESEEHVLAQLLTEHSLSEYQLLEEAIRQLRVGGGVPEKVASEAEVVSERFRLREELTRIRRVESAGVSETERQALVQEKLLRKREMKQLNPSQSPEKT